MGSSVIWLVFTVASLSSVLCVEYPAGVDPSSCPNYPFCTNAVITSSQIPSAYNTQVHRNPVYQPYQYNFPQYQPQQFSFPQYQPSQYQARQYQPLPYQQQQYQPEQYQSQNYQPQQYQASQQNYYQQPQENQAPQQYQKTDNQYSSVQGKSQSSVQSNQYSTDIQRALDRGEYIGDGDYHGEGLAEALAPGYEGYSQGRSVDSSNPSSYSANPANAAPAEPARYPAGVDPKSCPNYPFCT